jgi:DNA-binding transcriptional MerR regulator
LTREGENGVIERVKVEGASQITGVPVGTLRFWRATDQGPRSYVIGRRLWYDVADLDAWLDEQKAQSARGGAA